MLKFYRIKVRNSSISRLILIPGYYEKLLPGFTPSENETLQYLPLAGKYFDLRKSSDGGGLDIEQYSGSF